MISADLMEIDTDFDYAETNESLFDHHLRMDLSQDDDAPFLYMPNEILINIFSYLNAELLVVGRVCKFWNSIAFLEVYEEGKDY
jgi:hypothetical protein